MPKQNENFKIILGGDSHELDVNTLIVALSHLNTITSETNKLLSGGSKSVELKVAAHDKGSFVIDLSVYANDVIEAAKSIFGESSANYIANLTGIAAGIFAFAKFLGGKKPKAIDKTADNFVQVENNTGTIQVFKAEVINLYLDNEKVTSAVASTMKALQQDPHVESFEFVSQNENVTIEREYFNDLSKDENLKKEEVKTVSSLKERLTIVSPDFEFKRNWQCYHHGEKRSFSIESNDLKKAVIDGLKFGIGDAIIVDVVIDKEWSKEYQTYVNKSYTISGFHEYMPKNEQTKLDI